MMDSAKLLAFVLLAAGCGGGGGRGYYGEGDPWAEDGGASDDDAGGGDAAAGGPRDMAAVRPGPADLAVPRDLRMAPDLADPTWPAPWAALEDAVLVETNKYRARGATCGGKAYPAVGPLTGNAALRLSARLHSKDMADRNYFNHTSLDGRTPFDRMRAAGFNGATMGENIAAGNSTAAATVLQWMNSPGHCVNIMNGAYRYLGVGYAYGANSQYKHYWTQNFGG